MDIKIPEESVTGLVYKANECSFVLVFVMLSQNKWEFDNCYNFPPPAH